MSCLNTKETISLCDTHPETSHSDICLGQAINIGGNAINISGIVMYITENIIGIIGQV